MVESLFELRWERPAAVLSVALKISKEKGLNLEDILKLIAEKSAGWVKNSAETLLIDRGLREKIIEDVCRGLKPPKHLVKEAEDAVFVI